MQFMTRSGYILPQEQELGAALRSRAIGPAGLALWGRDGLTYLLRRVTPADVAPLNVFLYRLSDRSRRMRYMTGQPCSPKFVRAEVARMVAGTAGRSVTLLATDPRGGPGEVAGIAELICDRENATGELALVVMDDFQRRGLGGALLRQLLQLAQERGLADVHGDMYAENRPMQRLLQSLGVPYTASIHSGEMHVIVRVPE
jgi:acetyltransferase